jgi:UDP:flavonoid glycosyltransferase YjiC (YdhE family)
MRVLIATVGGRGDVAPFTGLGAAMRAAGHGVTVATHDVFEGLVTGCGLEFRALPGHGHPAGQRRRHGSGHQHAHPPPRQLTSIRSPAQTQAGTFAARPCRLAACPADR